MLRSLVKCSFVSINIYNFIKVDDKMKREIVKNGQYLRSHHDISPQGSALFINGQHFDTEQADMFTLLEAVKSEQRAVEGLHSLGLRGTMLQDILGLQSSSEGVIFFVLALILFCIVSNVLH